MRKIHLEQIGKRGGEVGEVEISLETQVAARLYETFPVEDEGGTR